jgi:adenosylcobinamide-GDP ribazoletransferase
MAPKSVNPTSRSPDAASVQSAIASVAVNLRHLPSQWIAAIVFYTQIPLPISARLPFDRAIHWAPAVGLVLGGLLDLLRSGLASINSPPLLQAVILVCVWLWVTGGLHLDGAMDTADGLAVPSDRRLAVMADSVSGAFGVMTAIALLLLKISAIASLADVSGAWVAVAAGWGRWGQQVAIAYYPYLKAEGKGSIHQSTMRSGWDTLPSLLLMLGVCAWPLIAHPSDLLMPVLLGSGGVIAPLFAAWFGQRLGGHTGDSYGATVEWTEAIALVVAALGMNAIGA